MKKYILTITMALLLCCHVHAQQIAVPRVEMMPNHPTPYAMRDWRQVAQDYDDFIFSFTRTKTSAVSWWQDYPAVWWDNTHINFPFDGFGMPSYVGMPQMVGNNPSGHEGINCLAAVVGGALAGVDKSNQYVPATGTYENFAAMAEHYFNLATGENVVLNYPATDSGQTFWYEIYPGVLFCQVLALYPGTGTMDTNMYIMADRWYNACTVMGGSASPWTVPDFTHTAFDFDTMTAVDNGRWKEPDSAAGIAWLEYMAYVKWQAPQHLHAAQWGIEYLQNRAENPLYEVLLPWGVTVAARMNAEMGFSYDVDKLLNWCFEPSTASDARYGWGVIAGDDWGGYDCDGLVGSATDGGGYAFAMNTFDTAAALTPLVRYDQRYARAIGKWMLNAANASRLFYGNGLDGAHQSGEQWADVYDPCYCISYEGLRKVGRSQDKVAADHSHPKGLIISGDYTDTFDYWDSQYQIFEEKVEFGGKDAVEHVWRIDLSGGREHRLWIEAWYDDAGDADSGFTFSYATASSGPYTTMFTITNTSPPTSPAGYRLPDYLTGSIYVKVQDNNRSAGEYLVDRLYVDVIGIVNELDTTPYAMGDGVSGGRAGSPTLTDFAFYGASHVGMLGGIVATTNVPEILQLDCVATDFYHGPCHPTYLYFNPHDSVRTVQIDVGGDCVDLYDTVSQTFLALGVRNVAEFDIPADSAVVVVLAPAGAPVTLDGDRKLIDDVVVDYRTNTSAADCPHALALPGHPLGDLDRDCTVGLLDLSLLAQHWLDGGPDDCILADIVPGDGVELLDFAQFTADWVDQN